MLQVKGAKESKEGALKRTGLFLSILFLLGACGPKEPPRYLDEGERHLVRLERVSPPPAYHHPAPLDVETIRLALGSVVVRHPTPLLKRFLTQQSEVKSAVFSPEDIALLADRFKVALERATPEERIAFFLTSRKNSLTTEVTSGVVFVEGTELHLILANHRAPVSKERQPWIPMDNALRAYEPESFEVVPQMNQKRTAPEQVPGRQEEIVIDYEALLSGAKPVLTKEGAEPAVSKDSIEERLRFLKRLREESLITEDEYSAKKKELLESLDTLEEKRGSPLQEGEE